MIVSFIIPHKGRVDFLADTIASIASLDCENIEIELLVITQESDFNKRTCPAMEQLKHLVITCDESETISTLRNRGVRECRGDVLAFIDADVELKYDWLSVLVELLTSHDYRLVSAMQVCHDNAPELEKIRTALSNAELDQCVTFLPGRNLLIRKEDFDAVGGFPEHLETCEDYYFTGKVAEVGTLFYSAKTSYRHIGEDKHYGQMYKKEIWRAKSNLKSLKGRSIPLREVPSFIVPIGIYTFLLLAIVSFLFGYYGPSLLLSCLGLLPFCLYSLRLSRLTRPYGISILACIKFYWVYFAARSVGTLSGLLSR